MVEVAEIGGGWRRWRWGRVVGDVGEDDEGRVTGVCGVVTVGGLSGGLGEGGAGGGECEPLATPPVHGLGRVDG